MRRTRAQFALALLIVAGVAATARAQVRDRPAREHGTGLFGGGQIQQPISSTASRHDLWLELNALGTHDSIDRATGGDASLEALRARSAGFVEGTVSYRLGSQARWLSGSGALFLTGHESVRAIVGGEGRVTASSELGRRNRVHFSSSLRNAPSTTFGEFGSLSTAVGPGALPDTDPTLGVGHQRSTMATLGGAFSREWTTRQSTSMSYSHSSTEFERREPEEAGAGIDSSSDFVSLLHAWQFRRSVGLQVGYSSSQGRYAGAREPLVGHGVSVGVDYARRISPSRQLAFSGQLGASYTDTISHVSGIQRGYWAPAGSASIRTDLGRSWAVTANYSRSATVLERVALQTFYSDTLAIVAGGLIGRRFDATLTAGAARGYTPPGPHDDGAYNSYTGSVQMRLAVTRWCAAMVAYNYYDYRVRGIEIPANFPRRSRFNGVRAGLSFWLPLYSSAQRRLPPQ